MTSRRFDLDYLKLLGLLGVILAHVNISPLVFQLRNFDVPLLINVPASGAAFYDEG